MLHRKLGRTAAGDDELGSGVSAWDQLTTYEDPLTSVVFERLSYLPPGDAWCLLRAASDGPDAERMPPAAPPAAPEWRFWPRLAPGKRGHHVRHVEPDLLVDWGDVVVVVEAKHRCAQSADQWVEEVHAVQADPRFERKFIILIAPGGAEQAVFGDLVREARQSFERDRVVFLPLTWRTPPVKWVPFGGDPGAVREIRPRSSSRIALAPSTGRHRRKPTCSAGRTPFGSSKPRGPVRRRWRASCAVCWRAPVTPTIRGRGLPRSTITALAISKTQPARVRQHPGCRPVASWR